MSPVFLKSGRSKTKTNSVFFPPNFESISKNQITDIRDIRRSRLRHTVSESQILDRKTYSITVQTQVFQLVSFIKYIFSEGYAENYASHTAEALSRVTQGALKKPNRRISVGLSQNGISLSVEDLRRRKTRIVVVGQENVGKSGWFSEKLFQKLWEICPQPVDGRPANKPKTSSKVKFSGNQYYLYFTECEKP